eukprot:226954_1
MAAFFLMLLLISIHNHRGHCVSTTDFETPDTPTYDQYHRRPIPIDNTGSSSRPCICTMQYDPVCCGVLTFSNMCMARCKAFTDTQCEPGRCVSTTESGSNTQATPENPTFDELACICTMQYDPVCCDGQTYSNMCMAKCSGQTNAQCAPGKCVSTTESDAETPSYDQYHRRPIPINDGSDTSTSTTGTVAAMRGVASQGGKSGLNDVPGYVWIVLAVLLVSFTVFFALWLKTKKQMDLMISGGNASYVTFRNDVDATI